MAWAVTVSKRLIGDAKVATLTYTDGARVITENFDVQGAMDDTFLANRAYRKVTWLDAQDQSFGVITEGALTPVAEVPPVDPVLTQAERDRRQFMKDYKQWLTVRKAIDVGILLGTEPAVVALLAKVRADFKPAYLDAL